MKNSILKSLLAICVAGIAIICTPKSSVAQVDMSLLTEAASSCQKDVNSSEYYNNKLRLSLKEFEIFSTKYSSAQYRNECIYFRYFYSQILSQFPWLTSAGEMLPRYPGSVAVSELAGNINHFGRDSIASSYLGTATDPYLFLDCLSTLDSESEECAKDRALRTLYYGSPNYPEKSNNPSTFKGWVCPSCFVAYNNNPSKRKMLDSFIEWFMSLEPSQRRELMSVLGDNKAQTANRDQMRIESSQAVREYNAIRKKVAQEEKEQRRRNLFGE